MASRQDLLDRICRERGLLAVYLFGSRADDGLRLLRGQVVPAEGSDLDIGIVFRDTSWNPWILSEIPRRLSAGTGPPWIALVPPGRSLPV